MCLSPRMKALRFYLDKLYRLPLLALKDREDTTMQDMVELFTVLYAFVKRNFLRDGRNQTEKPPIDG